MKKKLIAILICVFMTSVLLVGCGDTKDKVNEAINPPADSSQEVSGSQPQDNADSAGGIIEMTDEIKEAAAEEGISAQELLDIVKIRCQAEANSRGITLEEYLQMIEDNNSTPYQSLKEAADAMDCTIVEFHELMESIKTSNSSGGSLLEEELPAGYPQSELPLMEVDEITVMAENENYIDVTYFSQAPYDDLKTFYDDILNGTDGYRNKDYETVVNLKGTINGQSVKVDILDSGQVTIQIAK